MPDHPEQKCRCRSAAHLAGSSVAELWASPRLWVLASDALDDGGRCLFGRHVGGDLEQAEVLVDELVRFDRLPGSLSLAFVRTPDRVAGSGIWLVVGQGDDDMTGGERGRRTAGRLGLHLPHRPGEATAAPG